MSGLGITGVLFFGALTVFGHDVPLWLWAIAGALAVHELLAVGVARVRKKLGS